MDITVLGTKFNVYAYETKDIVEMSLVEGSVDVTTLRPPYQSIRVKPNEKWCITSVQETCCMSGQVTRWKQLG